MQKGGSDMEGIVILAVILVIFILMPKGSSNPEQSTNSQNTPSQNTNYQNTNTEWQNTLPAKSTYERSISLGTGNARYAYQTYEEYITIDNRGRESVNITGWYLKNGKDTRAQDFGGKLVYFPSDIAIIGQASIFVSPENQNTFGDIILGPREKAIVTTGSMGSQLPYKIVSFKENICSGYLENMPEYDFTPPLTRNCPRPSEEPGVSSLDTECRKFIERMPSCQTPEFNTRDRDGEICQTCVNGTALSSSCIAFIKDRFNYGSCVANYKNSPDFSGRTWRIFLGRGWEMWAREYETIELFDWLGRLVESRSY